jgi:ATP-dependent Lon protease
MAPREMRRAWMTAFGNAKLGKRDRVEPVDLPGSSGGKRSTIGFMH